MSKMDQTHIACKGSWVGGGTRLITACSLPDGCRCATERLAELAGEVIAVVEADLKGYFRNAHVTTAEELVGSIEA